MLNNPLLNNLFNYATSELSQDAFICWLLSFAAHEECDCSNLSLRSCAVELIKEFVPVLKDIDKSKIRVTDLKRQYKSVDVFAVVNETYGIIIEDKTDTKEHDNQLERYEEKIKSEHPKLQLCKVFYKTGFQSDYTEVIKANYMVFDRKRILDILRQFNPEIKNDIFDNYFKAIEHWENESKAYRTKEINAWNDWQVNGFYEDLKRAIFETNCEFDADFDYVHNQSGGFHAMWIYNRKLYTYKYKGIEYKLYLQMEFVNHKMNICLKVSIDDKEKKIKPRELREHLIWYQDESGKWIPRAEKYGFNKPARFGSGKTMTLGIYNKENKNYKDIKNNLREALEQFTAFTSEIKQSLF